ncbi:flavoprotein-like protein [Parasitella parasitica]|nr:flavoprotein-like protein [Parasitella parasitica]
MPTVYIIIYSLYHHIYKVAKDVQKGLESQGVTVELFQVPETLSDEILEKLHAPPKPDIPIITVDALTKADAFLFGVPTRFGTLPAQMKSFLDATGALWATGALSGKFVGTFFSTASQHGGQETTAYTLLTYFAHHGLNYVPLGFANSNLFDNTEVIGGSPYGAGTIANGDGSREPTTKELEIASTQGENFAKLLNIFHRGLGFADDNKKVNVIEEVVPATAAAPTIDATTTSLDTAPASEANPISHETPSAAAKDIEPVPAKEVPNSESKPKVNEKPDVAEDKNSTTVPTTPKPNVAKKEEKKESKCFCM